MPPKMVSMVGWERVRPLNNTITLWWAPARRAACWRAASPKIRNVRVALIEAGPADRHPFDLIFPPPWGRP